MDKAKLDKLGNLLKGQIKSGLSRSVVYGIVVNYQLVHPKTGEVKVIKDILEDEDINYVMNIICPSQIEFEW